MNDEPLTDLELYEIEAHAFHRMTGYMAPGKDPGALGDHRPPEERTKAWDAWWEQYGKCVRATIAAYREIMS